MRLTFLDPGQLRTELRLEAATLAPDGLGGTTETWVETAIVFALLEPVGESQRFNADQDLERITHRITCRYRSGIASGMRFRIGPRLLRIVIVKDPDETRRYLVCMTEELQ
jgi:SPP1 family predicted phage head-tail adaptor